MKSSELQCGDAAALVKFSRMVVYTNVFEERKTWSFSGTGFYEFSTWADGLQMEMSTLTGSCSEHMTQTAA